MVLYVDTSTVLRIMFGEPEPLAEWGRWQRAYSSDLMSIEARRAIDRLRLAGGLNDRQVGDAQEVLATIEGGIAMVDLDKTILRRAGLPMATAVKTLDALHLATALVLREQHEPTVVVATHDGQQANAARALGFTVIGCGSPRGGP